MAKNGVSRTKNQVLSISMSDPAIRKPVTIFDLLIIGSIVAVLMAVAIPGYRRSEEIEKAYRVKRELQAVESAVEQAAKKHGVTPGGKISFDRYAEFIKKPEKLAKEGVDVLGNEFGTQIAGERPKVPAETVKYFSEIVEEGFWDPYPTG